MTNHNVKTTRAIELAKIGACPRSAFAMLAAIPAEIVAIATSRQLAELLDANWKLAEHSKYLARRDCISERAIWDHEAGRLREIAF